MKTLLKLLLAVTIFTSIYLFFFQDQEPKNLEDTCVTITIQIKDDEHLYQYCTDHQYLGELIDEHKDALKASFKGKKSDPFGRLLVSLEDYHLKQNEFFFIYVDGIYGQYGLDQQELQDGSHYLFLLGTY